MNSYHQSGAMPGNASEQVLKRAAFERAAAQQNMAAKEAAPRQSIMDEIAQRTHSTASRINEQASVLEALCERLIGPEPACETGPAGGEGRIEPAKPSAFLRIQSGMEHQSAALERLADVVNRLARIA